MKIESSRQVFIEQTNGRRFAFTELLSEPKIRSYLLLLELLPVVVALLDLVLHLEPLLGAGLGRGDQQGAQQQHMTPGHCLHL